MNYAKFIIIYLGVSMEDRGMGHSTLRLAPESIELSSASLGWNWDKMEASQELGLSFINGSAPGPDEKTYCMNVLRVDGFDYDAKIHIMPSAILSVIFV